MEWKYANQTTFKVSVFTTDATALMANHPELSLYIMDNTFSEFFSPWIIIKLRPTNLVATISLPVLLHKSIIQVTNFYVSIFNISLFMNLMFIGLCIIVIVEEWKTNLMSLAILFRYSCAQHVSDINIQNDRCGNSTIQLQAPDDGYINVWNMLSTQVVK